MIAVQTVLGLVEPQSSGIAGGAFVVYYDATNDQLKTFDAREKAPAGATEERFLDADGNPLPFPNAWQSGLSVGVPGIPKLMEVLHEKYGNQPWGSLFAEAKSLATDGFELTERTEELVTNLFGLNNLFGGCEDRLIFRDPVAFEYFANEDCTAKAAGTTVINPEYAQTMDAIVENGAAAMYSGTIAEDIVAKINADRNPTNDSTISLEDLMAYEVIEREPVCKLYRDTYNICGMGPPSSGGLAVGQIFGILDNFGLSQYNTTQDVEVVHLFTQAMRLAFADRNLYVGDTDFVTVPVEGMLDADYLAERSGLISMETDMGLAAPGEPPGVFDPRAPQAVDSEGGTSHISSKFFAGSSSPFSIPFIDC